MRIQIHNGERWVPHTPEEVRVRVAAALDDKDYDYARKLIEALEMAVPGRVRPWWEGGRYP